MQRRLTLWMVAAVIVAHIASFVAFDVHGASPSDEEVYLAQTHLLAAGHVPYRDYLQVHPPGLMLASWLPYKLAGMTGARVFMAAVTLAVLLVLFALISRLAGPVWAAVGCGLLILTPAWALFGGGRIFAMRAVANLPILAGAHLLLFGRRRRSAVAAGACFGIALFFVLAAGFLLVAAGVALLLALWRDRADTAALGRPAVAVAAAAGVSLALLGGLFLALPGAWDQVVRFWLEIGSAPMPWSERLGVMGDLAWTNGSLFLLAGVGIFVARGAVARTLAWTAPLALLVIYARSPLAHPHYATLALPFLAVAATLGARWLVTTLPARAGFFLVLAVVTGFAPVQVGTIRGFLERLEAGRYERLVEALRESGASRVWSTKPIFALDAELVVEPWFNAADSRALIYPSAQRGYQASEEEYLASLARADAVVWEPRSAWSVPPAAQEQIRRDFPRLVYDDPMVGTVRLRGP